MPTAKKKVKDDDQGVLAGIYMFPNQDKYEGEYTQLDDGTLERNGNGTHTTSDGTVYVGNWSGDKMTGTGVIRFPSGAVYEGDFVDNQMHGQGKYTWPNKSFYMGRFSNNKMEGEGEFTDTENQVWTGTFRYKAAPGLRFKLSL